MASFSSLSIPLVKGIILPLVFELSETLSEWKQKLSIIGVCQLWRQLALGYVYNQVIFTEYNLYVKSIENLRQRRGQYYYKRGIKDARTALLSNVELLIMLDLCYSVKTVEIQIPYHGLKNAFFDELFKILEQTKGDWISVAMVSINGFLLPEEYVLSYGYMDFKDRDYYLDRLTDYVTNGFPSLDYISSHCFPEIVEKIFRLKSIFSLDKIFVVESKMSYLCIYPYLPLSITSMTLEFDGTDAILRLPVIYAESLQQLVLRELPSDFDWSCFSNPEIPHYSNVTFANLNKLHVIYRINYNDNGNRVCDSSEPTDKFGVKLIFPMLDNFAVCDCTKLNCLLYADFPNKASNVIYSGSASSIALCQIIKIKCSNLIVDVDYADKNQEALFYSTTNNFLAREEGNIILSTDNLSIYIDADMIKWHCLSELFIFSSIDFRNFVLILKKLPGLKSVALGSSGIQGIITSMDFTFHSFTQTGDFVVSSGLKIFKLDCEFNPNYYQGVFSFAKFIISYCPNLQQAVFNYILKDDVDAFIMKHGSTFPNLQKLAIEYEVFPELINKAISLD